MNVKNAFVRKHAIYCLKISKMHCYCMPLVVTNKFHHHCYVAETGKEVLVMASMSGNSAVGPPTVHVTVYQNARVVSSHHLVLSSRELNKIGDGR